MEKLALFYIHYSKFLILSTMLARNRRISKANFKSFGRAVSYHSPILSLLIYKKQDQTASQFSFICSKKVAKKAVKRNLLRRRGYNVMGKLLANIKSGSYFVFSFKKGAEEAKYIDIEREIRLLLEKARMIA